MRRYITDIMQDSINIIEITHENENTVFTACGEMPKRMPNTAIHDTWADARDYLICYHNGRVGMYRLFLAEHQRRVEALKKMQEP